jgi:hypothetical protein
MGKCLGTGVAAVVFLAAGYGAEAQTNWPPPVREALDQLKREAETGNRAADAVHAKDNQWSGSAPRPQSGELQTGQNLDWEERSAIASICHDVAHARVLTAYVRVDRGAPHPQVTCKLAKGGTVTVGFGRDNEPYRVR